jgi:hypothetical protein
VEKVGRDWVIGGMASGEDSVSGCSGRWEREGVPEGTGRLGDEGTKKSSALLARE